MTELTFARAFLTALDSRPIKISADHVEDPRGFPSNRLALILPKMPKTMTKAKSTTKHPSGAEHTLSVTIRSPRNPAITLALDPLPLSTSALDLKLALEAQSGVPADKARLLYNKKPVPDTRTLRDLLTPEQLEERLGEIEVTLMVMGGAAVIRPVPGRAESAEAAPQVVQGEGEATARTDEFWGDLRGFLIQRLKDEKEGEDMFALFKSSWEASKK